MRPGPTTHRQRPSHPAVQHHSASDPDPHLDPAADISTDTNTAIDAGHQTPALSAANQLAGFLTAAQRMDRTLRDTAALINTGFRADTMTLTAATRDAIKAIDPPAVAKTIPGGLPATLQDKVYLVVSDLASRRYAVNPILHLGAGQTGHPRQPAGQRRAPRPVARLPGGGPVRR